LEGADPGACRGSVSTRCGPEKHKKRQWFYKVQGSGPPQTGAGEIPAMWWMCLNLKEFVM